MNKNTFSGLRFLNPAVIQRGSTQSFKASEAPSGVPRLCCSTQQFAKGAFLSCTMHPGGTWGTSGK